MSLLGKRLMFNSVSCVLDRNCRVVTYDAWNSIVPRHKTFVN
jgi:hypothetical protein